MVKPDGVQRRLVGELIRRFDETATKLVALKLLLASERLLRDHYAEHEGKPFPKTLGLYRLRTCCGHGLGGANVIDVSRKLLGQLDPLKAYLEPLEEISLLK